MLFLQVETIKLYKYVVLFCFKYPLCPHKSFAYLIPYIFDHYTIRLKKNYYSHFKHKELIKNAQNDRFVFFFVLLHDNNSYSFQ